MLDKKHTAPDPELDVSDTVIASMELGIRSVSWEMVKKELQSDAKYKDLSTWIHEGCTGPASTLPLHIKPFWRLRGNLRCTDGVPMFDERTIVPESLRERVLSILHSAHQGVVSMRLRAEQAVFWPNIARDLEEVRNKCNTCNKIAPSQSNLPPVCAVYAD